MTQTMELDDLKAAWHRLDRQLQRQNDLNLQILRDGRLDRMRRGLRRLWPGQALRFVLGALGCLWFAPLWVGHWREPALMLSALVLHAYSVGLIAFSAILQLRLARIDYAAPVLTLQRELATLRRTYAVGGLFIGLPWWFLSAPLLVVLTRGAVMDAAPLAVWLQLAVGALGLLATWGFVRWANQPHKAALRRRLHDGAVSGSILRAQAALDELARFENE